MRNYDSLLQPLIGGGLPCVRYVFLLGLYYVRFVLRGVVLLLSVFLALSVLSIR